MKKFYLLIFIVLINFIAFPFAIQKSHSYIPPCSYSSLDYSTICVFYEDNERDFFIPIDDDLLWKEELFILVSGFYSGQRNFTISMFELEQKTISRYNPDTMETIYENKTDYTKIVNSKTFILNAGQNEWQNPTFSLVKLDSSNVQFLVPEDRKTKVVINYQDVNITFFHQTDYSRVPITQSRGEFDVYVIMQLIFLAIMFFGGALIGGTIFVKFGSYFPPFKWTYFLIVVFATIAVFSLIVFGSSDDTTGRTLRNTPVFQPQLLSLLIGILAVFILPGLFKTNQFVETTIISFDIPQTELEEIVKSISSGEIYNFDSEEFTKQPKHKKLILHSFIKKDKTRIYVKDPTSYIEFFKKLLGFGIQFDETNCLRIASDDKKSELIIAMDIIKEKRRFGDTNKLIKLIDENKKLFIPGLIGSIFITGILSMFLNLFIPILVFLFLFGIFLLIYYKISATTHYNVKKLSRNALVAMYDASKAQQLEKINSILQSQNIAMRTAHRLLPKQITAYVLLSIEKELFPNNFKDLYGDELFNAMTKNPDEVFDNLVGLDDMFENEEKKNMNVQRKNVAKA